MFFILKILNLAAFISFAAHITQSGHLGLQRDLRKLSAAAQHSLCLAEGKGDA